MIMKIAVVGCLHGKLNQVYQEVKIREKQQGFLIDLIVICGDFQAVRNKNDLKCMAVPEKYKELGDFYEYYHNKKQASHLTLVIGGNHEASNYFQTLPYGGWIAPNIYYMGYASVVKFNGVRFAGISGIYNRMSSYLGHFEHLPYSENSLRTAYHTRYSEIFKLMQIKEKIDVFLSHDWPTNVYKAPGAKNFLLKKKPFFKKDVETNQLGSPMLELLLKKLKPDHWFSAHLHVRFQTMYNHDYSNQNEKKNTHFLALDKCLPKRVYLEVVNVQSNEFNTDGLEYDLEWLSILRLTNEYLSVNESPANPSPSIETPVCLDIDKEKEIIKKILDNNLKIPNNFEQSLPVTSDSDIDPDRKKNYVNEQTKIFCNLFNITDPIQKLLELLEGKIDNPDKIDISDEELPDWDETKKTKLDEDSVTDVESKKIKTERLDFFIDTQGSR